jgi:hypothetical protein
MIISSFIFLTRHFIHFIAGPFHFLLTDISFAFSRPQISVISFHTHIFVRRHFVQHFLWKVICPLYLHHTCFLCTFRMVQWWFITLIWKRRTIIHYYCRQWNARRNKNILLLWNSHYFIYLIDTTQVKIVVHIEPKRGWFLLVSKAPFSLKEQRPHKSYRRREMRHNCIARRSSTTNRDLDTEVLILVGENHSH